ncbi:MAG: GAF domain-containing sensor histidine kinase [Flavobacteriaceae bacterium]
MLAGLVHKIRRISFGSYINELLITLLLFVGAFSTIIMIVNSQKNSLVSDLLLKSSLLKDAIINQSKLNLLLNDSEGFEELYNQVLRNSEGVTQISFYDAQKMPLWHQSKNNSAEKLIDISSNQDYVEKADAILLNFKVLDNTDELIGYIQFNCNTNSIYNELRSLRLNLMLGASLLILLFLGISILMRNKLLTATRKQAASKARIELTQQNNFQLETENKILEIISGQNDLNGIGAELVQLIGNYLKTNSVVLFAFIDNKLIKIASLKKHDEGNIESPATLQLGEGISGTVAANRKAFITGDTSKVTEYKIDGELMQSELTVPILLDDKLIGVIDAEHQQKNYFDSSNLEYLVKLSNIIALGFKNSITSAKIKESNEELSNYAHVVSHDLKTPLRSISAAMSWLREDQVGLSEQSQSYLKIVDDSLVKMDKLISDTLHYSEMKTKPRSEQEENVDLNALLNNLIKELNQSYPESTITLKNKLPVLKMNESRALQVFQNILDNSCKYKRDDIDSQVTITVDKTEYFFQFNIEDNGIGIPKEASDKVFSIFQKLHSKPESNGVGMSIVKKIIESYEGEIWYESEVGKGTTFSFHLPLTLRVG